MNPNGGTISGAPQVPDIVIITGMSGAGRSTAAKSLEDLDGIRVFNRFVEPFNVSNLRTREWNLGTEHNDRNHHSKENG